MTDILLRFSPSVWKASLVWCKLHPKLDVRIGRMCLVEKGGPWVWEMGFPVERAGSLVKSSDNFQASRVPQVTGGPSPLLEIFTPNFLE